MTLIDPIQLKPLLGDVAARLNVEAVACCDSTNSQLLAQSAHLPSGSVLVADQQQAGRGRRGRVWASAPEDSLTFSLLWRVPAPATRCNGLSLVVGLAIARALASLGVPHKQFGLKWPNDVLVCKQSKSDKVYQKLSGILVELVFASDRQKPTQAIIGIGLNLRPPAVDVGQAATGLSALFAAHHRAMPERHHIFAALLRELVLVLDQFCATGLSQLRYDWEDWHIWQNQLVHILDDGQELQRGLCLGVDNDGALLLHTATGVERVLAGDVSLRPIAAPATPNDNAPTTASLPSALCLDAGNTRLKWGVFDGATWLGRGAVAYAELEACLNDLRQRGVLAQVSHISISNVAGAAVAERLATALAPLALPIHFLRTSAAACGVTNGYAEPLRLGVDRWCALIGAWAMLARPCLVVSAGTATTIDSLDATGNFLGGFILPGISMMQTALASGTAQLPETSQRPHQPYPNNTHDAIGSGVLEATAGAVERAHHRLQQRYAGQTIPCMLTGGASPALLPLLSHLPLQHQPELVLHGAYQLGLLSS